LATRRVVTGVRMAGFYTVIKSWLKEQSSTHLQGQVFAVYAAVTLLAMAIGQFFILPSDVPALNLFAHAAMLFSLKLVPITDSGHKKIT
jgi:hypothetical protein